MREMKVRDLTKEEEKEYNKMNKRFKGAWSRDAYLRYKGLLETYIDTSNFDDHYEGCMTYEGAFYPKSTNRCR